MTPEQLERHYLKTLNARIVFLQEKAKTRPGKEVSYILSEIDALRWALNIIDAYKANNPGGAPCDALQAPSPFVINAADAGSSSIAKLGNVAGAKANFKRNRKRQ